MVSVSWLFTYYYWLVPGTWYLLPPVLVEEDDYFYRILLFIYLLYWIYGKNKNNRYTFFIDHKKEESHSTV